jgi:hypothetical protein
VRKGSFAADEALGARAIEIMNEFREFGAVH